MIPKIEMELNPSKSSKVRSIEVRVIRKGKEKRKMQKMPIRCLVELRVVVDTKTKGKPTRK